MFKYAKVINEKKQCEIGLGTNENFYQSIGMVKQDVEQSWDGTWYLKGFAPQKPDEITAEELRQKRNSLLSETDKFMVEDYPISQSEKEYYLEYRKYLRDITEDKDFPNLELLDFKDWLVKQKTKDIK